MATQKQEPRVQIGPHWNVCAPSGKHINVFPHEESGQARASLTGNILICKRVTFYSHLDEELFIAWMRNSGFVDAIAGIGDELHISIAADELHDDDLVELLALFYRYKIEMTQLQQFLTKDNKKWFFDNKKAYWHRRVFGA